MHRRIVVVVVDVDVTVVVVVDVDVTVVVVLEIVVVVHVHESHNTGQCCRIILPAKLFKVQEESKYGSSRPHSSGSPIPLHNPVVVVVVAVTVVVVVEATQASQAMGQRGGRPGNASHCADVTPSQSGDGSGMRLGSAPLHRSHIVPDHG